MPSGLPPGQMDIFQGLGLAAITHYAQERCDARGFAGGTGSVLPVQQVHSSSAAADPSAMQAADQGPAEEAPLPSDSRYQEPQDEQLPIDAILGKQDSLVREGSAIKAYTGEEIPQETIYNSPDQCVEYPFLVKFLADVENSAHALSINVLLSISGELPREVTAPAPHAVASGAADGETAKAAQKAKV